MRGLPGSVKSTTAINLAWAVSNSPFASETCTIFATYDYWKRPDGHYDFNYELITEAHVWNQRRAADAIQDAINVIIVDNVNTSLREMMPYVLLAKEAEYEVQLIEAESPWKYNVEECYKRNSHGVPYSTILRMYQEWESTLLVKEKLIEMGVKVV
jgi:hypothetical protein